VSALMRSMREPRVRAILVETWYLADTARAIGRETGAQVVVLPQTPGAVKGTEDYISHPDHLVTRIADALR
jgi:ABC-type Zn uptake system ZnuABC Zn-binding protein ZnuA